MDRLFAALDQIDARKHHIALEELRAGIPALMAAMPTPDQPGNLHAHTFHSFNCYGYSPATYALRARQAGMEVAGIVDFDVLDGVEEFHATGCALGLRTVASLETRVVVPEFAALSINSPGEPGIAYHMACGFARVPTDASSTAFLADLRARSARRNRAIVERVNAALSPAALDVDADVIPLTPGGNATERHLVLAYARKASTLFAGDALLAFWNDRLGGGVKAADLPEQPALLNRIRAATMKRGGPGYIAPTADSFPPLAGFNRFALAAGAVPTVAWLDGTSDGEQQMAAFCALAAESGACALNIIPDRNFTPGARDQKLANLHEVVALAERLCWPVIAGTEMNSYGQRFVDNFAAEELKPLVPVFRKGGFVLYAHTALQRAAGIGFAGPWADQHLADRAERLAWFAALGAQLTPATEPRLAALSPDTSPDAILQRL